MKIWEKIMGLYIDGKMEEDIYTKADLLKKLTTLVMDTHELDTHLVLHEMTEVDWNHHYYYLEYESFWMIYISPITYEDCLMDCEYELHYNETLCQDIVYTYLRYKGLYDEKVARTITISLPLDVHHCIDLIQEIVNDETFMNLEYIEEN